MQRIVPKPHVAGSHARRVPAKSMADIVQSSDSVLACEALRDAALERRIGYVATRRALVSSEDKEVERGIGPPDVLQRSRSGLENT